MGYRFLPLAASVTVILLLLFGVWRLDGLERDRIEQHQRADLVTQLSAMRARLESSLNQRLSLVQGLAAYAQTHMQANAALSEQGFRTFARELLGSQSGVRSLQLAPRAVVKYVYPRQGNEAVIGHDLLADPERAPAVRRAIDSKAYIVTGPVTLLQGGVALIARLPIYQYRNEQEVFWGFATILLDVDPLWSDAGLSQVDERVEFALRGMDGLGARGAAIYGSPGLFGQDALTTEVVLPHGSWQLGVLPRGGWGHQGDRFLLPVLGSSLALVVGLLVYLLLRFPARLQAQVVAGTQRYRAKVAELDQEKNLINAIVDCLPDLVFCKDLNGRYLSVNAAFSDYIGLDRGQLVGFKDSELFVNGLAARFHELDPSALPSGQAQRSEEWVTFADGRTLLLETLAVPLRDAQGDLRGMIGVSRDVTDSKATSLQVRKLSCVVQQSPTAVLITDQNGFIEYANESFSRITGYSSEELQGHTPRLLKSGRQSGELYAELWRTLEAGQEWHGELLNLRKDGQSYWARSSIYPISLEPEGGTSFVLLKQDITEEKLKDTKLKLATTVFDTTSEAIVITNSENRIQMVNPAFTRISGYSAEEVVGKDPGILSSGHHDRAFYAEMRQRLDDEHCWSGEIWNRRKNGEMYPEWLSIVKVFDEQGELDHHVAVFSDISKHKETEGLLYHQSNFDPLTELPNRMLMMDRLNSALARARRLKTQVAVLHIDVDRFKWVNDTYGHDAGDLLLKNIAQHLAGVVGESDTLARLSGDEFLMVLPDIRSSYDAEQVASAIGHRLAKPYQLAQGEAHLGASIGVAVYPLDAEHAGQLLQHADTAMGRAKAAGGNRHCFFTPEMNREVQDKARLEADLRLAILNEELEVFYQPLVKADSHQVAGAEALLRWRHPERGLVSPTTFIPLAEETGLIVPLGSWVLRQVCTQLGEWQSGALEALRVSVNLSPKQCLSERGMAQIQRVLRETNVDTRRLVLEITESMLIDEGAALAALEQLRDQGIRLALDDFGTGYSSLSYLKRFPINVLKIDRSFVKDLPKDGEDAALVEAMLAMARSLNLEVVAEGVETQAQQLFLRELSCDYIQGFYYGEPMPRAAFEGFVKQYNAQVG